MSEERTAVPYWRLSSFYFFYFGALGVLLPYWAVLLKHRGFNAIEIGELMALLVATKIVAPNIWGWIADHAGLHMPIIRAASLLTVVGFVGVFFAEGFWAMAAVMALFSFFWNAALPQFEVVTLNHLGAADHRYGVVRLWGSVGCIITVLSVGVLLDGYGPWILPWAVLASFLGIWLSSLVTPDVRILESHEDHGSLWGVIRGPQVLALFAVVFLLQASHGPYYTFYTLYLEDHGYNAGVIGSFWALGVVAEIGVFLVMSRWLGRFGPYRLMLIALALTVLRWMVIAWFPGSFGLMVFAQLLHAASFGIGHAVAIHWVHRFFRKSHQARGQALYSSVSFGAGGAVGSLFSGYFWDSLGPGWTYTLAAGIALTALGIAWLGLREGRGA